jgi:hypothetical protein
MSRPGFGSVFYDRLDQGGLDFCLIILDANSRGFEKLTLEAVQ